jgi:thymidylate kinase
MHRSTILQKLVAELDRLRVNHCFLRNYDFSLNQSPDLDADIDILVLSGQLSLIDNTLKDLGFFRGTGRGESKHIFYGKYINQHSPVLALDFHLDDLSWYEVPYISGSRILERKMRKNGLFVPSPEDNFLMLLVHSSLNGIFKREYIDTINSIQNTEQFDEEYVLQNLRSIWHTSFLKKFWKLVLNREYKNILILRPYLVCSLLIKRLKYFTNFLNYLYITRIKQKLKSFFSRSILVSFMGVDGSGKTTTANGLQSVLDINNIKSDIIYMGRWRNQVLPMANVSKKYGMTGLRSPKKKEGLTFKLYCVLRDLAYLADMWLRYWLKLFPKMKLGYTIITDRYVYDLLLDVNSTLLCRIAVRYLFPKPLIVFYLDNEPDVIRQRKRELDVNEMLRQMEIFNDLKKYYHVIEVKSDNINKTIDRVAQEYFSI